MFGDYHSGRITARSANSDTLNTVYWSNKDHVSHVSCYFPNTDRLKEENSFKNITASIIAFCQIFGSNFLNQWILKVWDIILNTDIFDIIKHSLYSKWWKLCRNKQFINKSDLMSFQLEAAECLWLTMISWRWDASNLIQQCSLLPKQGSSEAPRGLAIVERKSPRMGLFFFLSSQKRKVFISNTLPMHTFGDQNSEE